MSQRTDMATWLEENERLYNKMLNAYNDFMISERKTWESKSSRIGMDVQVLKIVYRSIFTPALPPSA